MNGLTERLKELSGVCCSDEQELIEQMVHSAADYVRQVVVMESTAMNLAGRDKESFRSKKFETDGTRSQIHNGLIDKVRIVNRICKNHDLPPIYEGPEHRRNYGDFTIALVEEIFRNRTYQQNKLTQCSLSC